jgi:hypothetical protein
LPSGWSVISTAEPVPPPQGTQAPDELGNARTQLFGASVGSLSDCSADFTQCDLSNCSRGSACPPPINRAPTTVDAFDWVTASLDQLEDPCKDQPELMSIGSVTAGALNSTCANNPDPFNEVHIVADNGVGFKFRFEGAFDDQTIKSVLDTAAFEVPPWSVATPPPTPSPTPNPLQIPTPEPTLGPAPTPSYLPAAQRLNSDMFQYSIVVPAGWQFWTVGPAPVKFAHPPDELDGDGVVVDIRLETSCPDVARCDAWMRSSLSRVDDPCGAEDVAVPISLAADTGFQLTSDCASNPSPFSEVRLDAGSAVYSFRFTGAFNQLVVTSLLRTFRPVQ